MPDSEENTLKRYEELLDKHGVCRICGEMISHHLDEPFASCACGTSEWYTLTPYMELEKQIKELKKKLDEKEGE